MPERVQVPVPLVVTARLPPPAPLAIALLTLLLFELPFNCKVFVLLLVAEPVMLVSASPAVVGFKIVVLLAVGLKVAAPKASTAEPLVTLAPCVILRVFAPMVKVPKVCVIPAPAVARSEIMVVVPVTVVL